jgi:serine/threonine-protein kinase
VIDGRYRLAAHLANGGMGAIFRAEHVYMRKELALKLLRPELSVLPDIAERFRRESEIAASLEHANIVRVTDFGRSADGYLFLVMELLAGESLFERMRVGPMPVEEALPVLAQVCSGLEAAHARGVVHRDLKPENVFLVDHPSPWVKLLDFGIAKITDPLVSSDTAAGVVVGTPEYASPEQATGAEVDGRADVYALGIVAWRMLAGYHPFPTDDSRRLLMMHATRPVPSMADARPELLRWPGVAAIVDRACAKDPDARFQSAAEMRAAIEASLPPHLRSAATAPTASPFPQRTATPQLRSAQPAIDAALEIGRATALAASSSAPTLVVAPPRRSRLPMAAVVATAVALLLATGLTVAAVHRRAEARRAAAAAAEATESAAAAAAEARDRAAAEAAERARADETRRRVEELARETTEPQVPVAVAPELRERPRETRASREIRTPAQAPVTSPTRDARDARRREEDSLVDAARKASGAARLRALAQLRDAGAEGRIPAAEAYGPLLTDGDCDVRKAAARRLGELGDKAALTPLRTLASATREVDEGYTFKRRAPECGSAEAAAAVSRIERQSLKRAAR